MTIGLIDVDGKLPNLALMKISTYMKSCGEAVEFYQSGKKYENELTELNNALIQIKVQSPAMVITADHIKMFLRAMLSGDTSTDKFRESIFDTFVRQITVYPDNVKIQLNYSKEPPTTRMDDGSYETDVKP